MRSPRAFALRATAAVVAVATAALVASDLAALHRRAHDFGPARDAIVARHDLTLGHDIRPHDVRVRHIHESQLQPGVIANVDAVVGRVVTVPVVRGGFLTGRNIAPQRRTGLDGAIPRGTRALRVVVIDAVRPRVGAAVDVIATFGGDSFATEATSTGESAVVVADSVLVLATDEAQTAEGASALGVTLLVSPLQARDLAYAATHGVITIALVPPEDARAG
jgi:Flp pilus assembly protein CpaB